MSRPSNRPSRTPIGSRNVLTVNKPRKGYKSRWVNDVPGRIEMFEEAGYTLVRNPTEVGDPQAGAATQLGSVVSKPVGGGIQAVLMEIPEDFYREDQEAKELAIKEKERSLLSDDDGEGTYGDGISVRRKSRFRSDDD